MQCWKCSAELQGAKKFCGHCGAAILEKPVDPFASTVQPNPRAPASAPVSALPSSRVSPLASSAIEFSESVREMVVAAHPESSVQASTPVPVPPPSERAHGGTLQMQAKPAKAPPVTGTAAVKPPSIHPPSVGITPVPGVLGPGVAVRVRWANGQKSPGTIWQVHGTQVLVAFADGQRHWVESSFVERT